MPAPPSEKRFLPVQACATYICMGANQASLAAGATAKPINQSINRSSKTNTQKIPQPPPLSFSVSFNIFLRTKRRKQVSAADHMGGRGTELALVNRLATKKTVISIHPRHGKVSRCWCCCHLLLYRQLRLHPTLHDQTTGAQIEHRRAKRARHTKCAK